MQFSVLEVLIGKNIISQSLKHILLNIGIFPPLASKIPNPPKPSTQSKKIHRHPTVMANHRYNPTTPYPTKPVTDILPKMSKTHDNKEEIEKMGNADAGKNYSNNNIKMRKIIWALAAAFTLAHPDFKTEIQTAFLLMDFDGDGIVTKAEMVHALVTDVDWSKYAGTEVADMMHTVDLMVHNHDKDGNGLDFLEMYTASGGKLQDL